MRIQRAIARAGIASRRAAEQLVAAGRVTVNGAPAHVGQVVSPERDAIAVDGAPIGKPTITRWIVLNKPAGVMTTRSDPRGRPTVFELVPAVPGLTYVGRLDLLTEGVLLFTTDGAAAHALTHPSREIEREYVATVRGPAVDAARRAVRGVQLEDGPLTATAASAESMGGGRWALSITIAEGRNREIRRLCAELSLDVERLVRIRFGPVTLGTLEPGRTRALSRREHTILTSLTLSNTER